MTSALGPLDYLNEPIDGKYQLIDILGRGNFGEVWHARHLLTGRECALKLMNMEKVDPDAAWTEAQRLTRLESDFLVRVHGAGQTTDSAYIDMEIAPGGSAGAAAGQTGVSARTAIEWVSRVADGLQLCHEHDLLHRDVKPDNILLDGAGNALLGDFGVTGVMNSDGQTSVHGDINIIAPEAFTSEVCTRVTDVYSLGVTLIALIGGRLPLSADRFLTVDEFVSAVQAGLPDVRGTIPHVSLQLSKVIATAVSLDPERRYQTPRDFRTALNNVRAGKRDIVATEAHHLGGTCWDAIGTQGAQDVHVCTEPGSKHVTVTTHFIRSGSRIRAGCGTVPARDANNYLRRVFRSLL
jgi:serine/threonine protein kinase